MPAVPAAGIPDNSPFMAVNVTPDGSVPVIDKVGVGAPVVVTVKLLADVMVNVALPMRAR